MYACAICVKLNYNIFFNIQKKKCFLILKTTNLIIQIFNVYSSSSIFMIKILYYENNLFFTFLLLNYGLCN